MERRRFVCRLPVLSVALVSASGCSGPPYLRPLSIPGGLRIRSSELGQDGDAFVQTPEMERPIYLRRGTDGGFTAVLASCTHRGCQPEPVADRLSCPCHGSEFAFDGAVLAGPAERPLVQYVVEEQGLELRILPADRDR